LDNPARYVLTTGTESIDAEAEVEEETAEDSSALEGSDEILDSVMDEEGEFEPAAVGMTHEDRESIPRTRQTLVIRVRNESGNLFRISIQTSILSIKMYLWHQGKCIYWLVENISMASGIRRSEIILFIPFRFYIFCA
jgi:hypothetical protein